MSTSAKWHQRSVSLHVAMRIGDVTVPSQALEARDAADKRLDPEAALDEQVGPFASHVHPDVI